MLPFDTKAFLVSKAHKVKQLKFPKTSLSPELLLLKTPLHLLLFGPLVGTGKKHRTNRYSGALIFCCQQA